MYISEEVQKAVIKSDINKDTVWLIKAFDAERKLNMDLGSNNIASKQRPFVILKILEKTNEVCVCFFSSKQYSNRIGFNLKGNCKPACKFTFIEESYVYKNKIYRLSLDVFYNKLAKYCGKCNNIDYIIAKLRKQIQTCS